MNSQIIWQFKEKYVFTNEKNGCIVNDKIWEKVALANTEVSRMQQDMAIWSVRLSEQNITT